MYLGFGLLALLADRRARACSSASNGPTTPTLLLEANALLQLFQAYRVGLVFGAIIPLGLGLVDRGRPAPARRPLDRVPASRAHRLLRVARRVRAHDGRRWGATVASAAATPQAVDLFLAGHGLMIVGLLASAGCVATSVLTTRAPGHDDAPRAAVRLVGTDRRARHVARASRRLRRDRLLCSSTIGSRRRPTSVAPRASQPGSAGRSRSRPSSCTRCRRSASRAETDARSPSRHRQPLRGVVFAGIALVGVAALAATTQQFVPRRHVRHRRHDVPRGAVPFLIFAGLPLLGLVVVLGLGAAHRPKNGLANGRPRITRRVPCSRSSASA